MTQKVLISDTLSKEGIEILKKAPGIEADVMTNLTKEELKGVIKDYDGLVIRSATKVTAEIIDAAAKLKVIGRAGIGLDNVDAAAASKRGIVVMNTPGGNTITTAEHAIAMMLSLARKIPQATGSMKTGKWEKSKFMGSEVYNKTLGVVGMGRVGSIVANRAQGLRMNVLAYDPFLSPEAAEKMGITLVSFDKLLAEADFITIHTPLTAETRNLINKATIEKMKKGVYIINCARGGIVCEADLQEALASGRVGGAALDVFEEEPTKNRELLAMENLIATPHLGASTRESEENCAAMAVQELRDYLELGNIKNSVNFPNCEMRPSGKMRLCITGKNVPNILGSITRTIGEHGINVAGMINNHKDGYAYTIIDVDDELTEELVSHLKSIEGVISTRIIKLSL